MNIVYSGRFFGTILRSLIKPYKKVDESFQSDTCVKLAESKVLSG